MTTYYTAAIQTQLEGLGESPDAWANYFQSWKGLGPAGEYNDYFFGKDSAYIAPPTSLPPGRLMHVHLVPLLAPKKLELWDFRFKHRSRKTSNRALVYADNGNGDYLLIYVLDEPSAHEIAKMLTSEHREIMHNFVVVAEAFFRDSSIIG